ncbi:mitochondrial tryptophanyl-tRNA synthetase (TrpRS) [Andalucia godoyi]|uniref:Tryptophan--tRNA ligase, mitochondrial n=1 Tax=Andalucia godoyi TaxID=505711 RepID=A0A8K0AIK8_ANDGO|nr:mitochondrial tryptophanyl-tRNA synthetase (TrpRS) [Andalucia godoyi]|eukprot:ANDGO_03181.mRNA.1 mitochondrial tryptophanyl-tRNA synthetase (TrpRS)
MKRLFTTLSKKHVLVFEDLVRLHKPANIRVLSGIQPTGTFHLGNYLGALRTWKQLVEYVNPANSPEPITRSRLLFSIVDMHSITVRQDPDMLRASVLESAAAMIACGVDPSRSVLFQQSAVSGHAELAWILSCSTPLGWLRQMHQFKSKSEAQKEGTSLGLLSYPVLMAADVLLYRSTHVPVGEDQLQHLELTRDIANHFHSLTTQQSVFQIPTIVYSEATRVMSLRDAAVKMSKSDPLEASRILLTDSVDVIDQKIRKAKTDSIPGISADPARAEVMNLLTMYAALSNESIASVAKQFADSGHAAFKRSLAEVIQATVVPIGNEISRLKKDEEYLRQVMELGAEEARTIAHQTLLDAKRAVGLL